MNSCSISRRAFMAELAAFAAATVLPGCRTHSLADRLGVCSWSFRMPLDGVAAEMRKMGLKKIHLALQPFLEGDERHGAAEDAKGREAVERRLASGEWDLTATMISFRHEDYSTLETIKKTGGVVPDDTWPADLALVKKAARLSSEWKAPYISLHAGFLDESNAAAVRKYTDRVKALRDVCGEAGVPLILETGQETPEDLAAFLSSVEGVGVNFDPANMILYAKGNPVKAVKTLSRWIRHVHVKDARYTKVPGTWGEETPWGDGDVIPSAFVKALNEVGYSGDFAIEREGGDNRAGDIALAARRFAAL